VTLLRYFSRLAPVFVLGLAVAISASAATIAGSVNRGSANNVINPELNCGAGVLCM